MDTATKPGAVPTKYWHRLEDERIQCDLCPRFCKLHEGQREAIVNVMHLILDMWSLFCIIRTQSEAAWMGVLSRAGRRRMRGVVMDFAALLHAAGKNNASDVRLQAGAPPISFGTECHRRTAAIPNRISSRPVSIFLSRVPNSMSPPFLID